MCRGFQQSESEKFLKIKAFYLRFALSSSSSKSSTTIFPDSLTLHYLPRINGTPLEINHSKIRPDSPAFLTLHRLLSPDASSVCFGTRERVKASQGARFEVFLGDLKVLKGFFRKHWEDDDWKMECGCGLDGGPGGRMLQGVVKEAELCVAAEGDVAMTEMVEMVAKRPRKRSNKNCFQGTLEEIPEESEYCDDNSCCCCSYSDETEEDTEEDTDSSDEEENATKMDGVSWAVDVGIWVMCLGVGLLVSTAASKRLLRRIR